MLVAIRDLPTSHLSQSSPARTPMALICGLVNSLGWNAHRFLSSVDSGNVLSAAAALSEHPELLLSRTFLDDSTALHLAASHGDLQMLQLLLQHEKDFQREAGSTSKNIEPLVNATSIKGKTPLMKAAAKGHFAAVQLLIDAVSIPRKCMHFHCC